jgi:Thiol:disulfide interchange protein
MVMERSVDLSDVGIVTEESSGSALSWSAVVGGAVAAAAVTLILVALGAGLGFASLSPWSRLGASATTFAVTTAIWFVVVQWLSSAFGGYLAGRLRSKWVGIHTDEGVFRDTAMAFSLGRWRRSWRLCC